MAEKDDKVVYLNGGDEKEPEKELLPQFPPDMDLGSKPKDDERFETFDEFWPFYLEEHSKPETRNAHYTGTSLGYVSLTSGGLGLMSSGNGWWLLSVPIAMGCGYGFAWYSHMKHEKNRPATFTYPLWSLKGDLKMHKLMLKDRFGLKGGLEEELAKYDIRPRSV